MVILGPLIIKNKYTYKYINSSARYVDMVLLCRTNQIGCHKCISKVWLSNYIPKYSVGRDYIVMPWVPASGSIKVLKYATLNCIRSSMRCAPDSTSISELFHLVLVLRPSRYRIPNTVSAEIVTDLQHACNTLAGTTENLCNGIYKSINRWSNIGLLFAESVHLLWINQVSCHWQAGFSSQSPLVYNSGVTLTITNKLIIR